MKINLRKIFKIAKFSQKEKPIPFNKEFFKNLTKTQYQNQQEENSQEVIEENSDHLFQESISKQSQQQQLQQVTHEVATFEDSEQTLLVTKIGKIIIPNYLKEKYKNKISNVYFLTNTTNINYLKKIFKNDKTSLIIFPPGIQYKISRRIFESLLKRLQEIYFDQKQIAKQKNQFNLQNLTQKERLKIYHDTKRKLMDMRSFLQRIIVLVDSSYQIRQSGDIPNVSQQIQQFCVGQYSFKTDPNSYQIYDSIIPLYKILKFHSLKNMAEKGVMFDFISEIANPEKIDSKKEILNEKIFKKKYSILEEKEYNFKDLDDDNNIKEENQNIISNFRIFNFHDVFPPTNKVLYKFIFNEFQKSKFFSQRKLNFLDLGCGSGVLSILFRKAVQSTFIQFYSLDNNPNALKNSQLNAQLNNMVINTQLFDLTKVEEQYQIFETIKKFDFIIANPPWMISKPVADQDNGNYDPDAKFIKSIFHFVKERLIQQGNFWLIFSNIAQNCGLVEEDFIERLAKENNLIFQKISTHPIEYFKQEVQTELDLIKIHSEIKIYHFTVLQLIIYNNE